MDGASWVYVIDHDRRRFAVEPVPVVDAGPWRQRIFNACARGRRLSGGAIPVAQLPTLAAAVERLKAELVDHHQFDSRTVFASAGTAVDARYIKHPLTEAH